MKKVLLAVFAHPDDEAFGPAGTLCAAAKAGVEVDLVLLTAGEAGANPDKEPNLGDARLEEWRAAANLIGARSTTFLGYADGNLNNLQMIEIATKLEKLVKERLHDLPEDAEIELMSLDTNGLTGHIDHIVAARATCLAFYRLKQREPRLTRLRLYCLPSSRLLEPNTDWIYMDAGRPDNEITEVVDNRHLGEELVVIARAHNSQRGDGEAYLKNAGDMLGVDHFIVKT